MPKNMPPHHFKNFSTWMVCSCTCCSELEPSWLLNFSCWPGFNWISWWCFTGEGLLIKYLDDFVFEVCHQRLFLYSDPNSLLLLWKLEVIWVDLDVSIPNLSDHHVSKKREFSDPQNMQTGKQAWAFSQGPPSSLNGHKDLTFPFTYNLLFLGLKTQAEHQYINSST